MTGHRAGKAPSTGFQFDDDVQLKFGTDSDATVKFTSADSLVDVGGTANWRFAALRGVEFRTGGDGVNSARDLLKFTLGGPYERPWISWYDSSGNRQVTMGYHETNLSDLTPHTRFEIKTGTAGTTRFAVEAIATFDSKVRVWFPQETVPTIQTPNNTQGRLEFVTKDSAGTEIQSLGLNVSVDTANDALLDLNLLSGDATSDVHFRMFRATNTTGSRIWSLLRGNNSTTAVAQIQITGSPGTAEFTVFPTVTQNLVWKSGTSFSGTLDHAITAARAWTFPDEDGTVSLIGRAETLSGIKTFSVAPALSDGVDLTIGTGTGSKLGQAASKLGFFGVAPVARPSALTQTYATASATHADFTSADIGAFTGGVTGFADTTERNNIRTQYNALRADVANLKQFVNQAVDQLQSLGLLQ